MGATLLALITLPTTTQAFSVLTTLYNFQGLADGGQPGGVILGPAGVLYGTTFQGGLGYGTVYQLTPSSLGWTETVLYMFQGGTDGIGPKTNVVLASGGVLYGTTSMGGASGKGTVFQLTPPASQGGPWTESVIYSFTGANGDGATPFGGVSVDPNGILYGTTTSGGASNYGAVWQLLPPSLTGDAYWLETILYSFTKQNNDGATPTAGVTIAPNGTLYGTTHVGGNKGKGTVYLLTPPNVGGSSWIETILHSFGTRSGDGVLPYAGVTLNTKGELFGTTYGGGPLGFGSVYAINPPSANNPTWTESILYQFTGQGTDGANPYGGVLIGPNGVLFGTTNFGGGQSGGVVYTLTPPTTKGSFWVENTLYAFTGGSDGGQPGGITFGATGYMYGTTATGGLSGSGTVFQLTQ